VTASYTDKDIDDGLRLLAIVERWIAAEDNSVDAGPDVLALLEGMRPIEAFLLALDYAAGWARMLADIADVTPAEWIAEARQRWLGYLAEPF
jgi:hypothetical protein